MPLEECAYFYVICSLICNGRSKPLPYFTYYKSGEDSVLP